MKNNFILNKLRRLVLFSILFYSVISNGQVKRQCVAKGTTPFKKEGVTILAHRGYWRYLGDQNSPAVQNSYEAIDAAVISHADMIELDVRSTKDKKAICFHDDKPQNILRGIRSVFPTQSVYDLNLSQLQQYDAYDRFGNNSGTKILTLREVFSYYSANNYSKPINLDIGIPDQVPQGSRKVSGKPFFDAAFLEAVSLAKEYNLLDRVIFKGKYTVRDPLIWESVNNLLNPNSSTNCYQSIFYTPKYGEDTPDMDFYFDEWMAFANTHSSVSNSTSLPNNFTTPVYKVVNPIGIEIRLKNDESTDMNTKLMRGITLAKEKGLKVGIFSESPSTCQGYWTKSAVEKYINFNNDKRNNFDWLLDKGYDYIITDFPEMLYNLLNAQ